MIYLPLGRLLTIATCQTQPEEVAGSLETNPVEVVPGGAFSGKMDTHLAARMAANALRLLVQAGAWQRHRLGARGVVGEAMGLRLMVWMDSSDEQPGMVAVWDLSQSVPADQTAYGELAPRPVLVIGRNIHTGEHFVTRYLPGAWLERLEHIARETASPPAAP